MSTEKPQGYHVMPTHADEAQGQIWIMDPAGDQICAAAGDTIADKMRHATRIATALNLSRWWPSRERHPDGSPIVGKAGAQIQELIAGEPDTRADFFDDLLRHMSFLEGVAETQNEPANQTFKHALLGIVGDIEFAGMRIAWLESAAGKSGPVKGLHRRAFILLGREPIEVINEVEACHANEDHEPGYSIPDDFVPLFDLLCAVPGCSGVYYAEEIGDEAEDVMAHDAIRFTLAADADIPPNWLLIETICAAHLAACRQIVASAPAK